MNPQTILGKIKENIGLTAWRIFLWSKKMTAETYLEAIYKQDVEYRSTLANHRPLVDRANIENILREHCDPEHNFDRGKATDAIMKLIGVER